MANINFTDIINRFPDGILILDEELNIIFFNKKALLLTGLNENDAAGSSINILNIDQDEPFVKEGFINCLKNKRTVKNNFILNREILVFIKSAAVDDDGRTLTLLSLCDISSLTSCPVNLNRKENKIKYLNDLIVGKDEKIVNLNSMIEMASESTANVLITGESGTGKELVAKAIHNLSDRRDKPFITVNCSALTETLLESELFGHIKGSFTGAYKDKIGKFELAHQGSIFLDEIGDISPVIQIKLLRVMQEKTITRVGDNTEIKVDMRIITATNKNLRELASREEFREDLFYRLNVFNIEAPPLRDRSNDIPLLGEYFIKLFNRETGKNIKYFTDDAMRLLMEYCWPGNVRELQNAIEHAFVVCTSDHIDIFDLPNELRQVSFRMGICSIKKTDGLSDKNIEDNNMKFKPRKTISKDDIIKLLEINNGNKALTSRQLGISRVALWKKMKKLGIS